MSVRTWDSGTGQNAALFVMMIFWMLLIAIAIIQSQYFYWEWNLQTVVGLIFVIGIMYTWVWSFFYKKHREPPTKETEDVNE
jgi:membrane protein implicated in regulation of membrane protease activity